MLLILITTFVYKPTSADQTNPTPPVIIVGTPTPTSAAPIVTIRDHFEPNNTFNSAAVIGLITEYDLTLEGEDVDYYTGLAKTGQTLTLETFVRDGLDTKITLYWAGQQLSFNDDKDPLDTGSLVTFTAPGDGWFTAVVEQVGLVEGSYDLSIYLEETPTPAPTGTPLPTATPIFATDGAEPNDTFSTAFPITVGAAPLDLSLVPNNPDYFKFVAKAGQMYQCQTVSDSVDTLLSIHS